MIDFYADVRAATRPCSQQLSDATLGTFDPMSSCLSFRSDIRRSLASQSSDEMRTANIAELSDDDLFAYSVFVHETMHWWQHIGTTSGFVDGMGFLAQAYRCSGKIRSLLAPRLLKKPLCDVARTTGSDDPREVALNALVNGWMDIEFAHLILNAPANAAPFLADRFFDAVGTSIATLYGDFRALMIDVFGDDLEAQPDLDRWVDEVNRCIMTPGSAYDYRASVRLAPLGLRAICEGQAQLVQEQLYEGARCPRRNLRARFAALPAVYSEAFEQFLQIALFDWPERARSPECNAFLFACDLALACDAGYPADVSDFCRFPEDVNAGMRFLKIASWLRRHNESVRVLEHASDETYLEVAGRLCRDLEWSNPVDTCEKVVALLGSIGNPNSYDVALHSQVAFLAIRHLEFMRQRAKSPAWFCWPGQFLVAEEERFRALDSGNRLRQHHPPFILSEDPDKPLGVVTPLDEFDYESTLIDKFVGSYVFCDLVRQIVARPGPLNVDYRWIGGRDLETWRGYCGRILQEHLGIDVDSMGMAR